MKFLRWYGPLMRLELRCAVTFGEDDDEFRPTLDRHFDGPPRISGLFTDLSKDLNGTYSWKQVECTVAC